MVKVKSRPKCAQKTAVPVIVEDQIDAAIAPAVRTSSVVGREMAEYYLTFREAEDDERESAEVEVRRKAVHERMDALWAEYEAGPLPIEAPADILAELMAVTSYMRASIGRCGFDLVASITMMERLWRIIRPVSEIFGIDTEEIGADAISLSIDENIKSEMYYARYVVLRALEQGIAFRLTPGGKLEIFRRDGDRAPGALFDSISEEDLVEEVKRLITEKGASLAIPSQPAGLAGQTWWLTRDDMRNVSRDALRRVCVGWGPRSPDRDLIVACKRLEDIENEHRRIYNEHPVEEEKDALWDKLSGEQNALAKRISNMRAVTTAGVIARAKVILADDPDEGICDGPFIDKNMRGALLRDLIAMDDGETSRLRLVPDLEELKRGENNYRLVSLAGQAAMAFYTMEASPLDEDVPTELVKEYWDLIDQSCQIPATSTEAHLARVKLLSLGNVQDGRFVKLPQFPDQVVRALVRDVAGARDDQGATA
ncbi:hypothetical protein HLH33_12030 [Gluconacetobacter diazotrophicus]|uniref:Uncharacterized protein n=1 Tax=Gluconacetobacter diazotrophicus TaxID=33996 RepID=A0A7W4I686_GLUDI|nr:hypothetical protein [Gluconacetobacter diazotrophicus]MBB2157029.1 hypothetical protein [Gluconacetobacter diazotrophicus]